MPTDDLCNYIENKANQNDPAASNMGKVGSGAAIGQVGGVRAASKVKKRGQTMSIEDQETKSLEQHIMDDINKLQNFAQT